MLMMQETRGNTSNVAIKQKRENQDMRTYAEIAFGSDCNGYFWAVPNVLPRAFLGVGLKSCPSGPQKQTDMQNQCNTIPI